MDFFKIPFKSNRMSIGNAIAEPMKVRGLHEGKELKKVYNLLDDVGLSLNIPKVSTRIFWWSKTKNMYC